MEETLISAGIEMMLSEVLENFSAMALVFLLGVRVDEYVIEVHQYTNIEQVTKGIIHEALDSSRYIGKSERHYTPVMICIFSSIPFYLVFPSS